MDKVEMVAEAMLPAAMETVAEMDLEEPEDPVVVVLDPEKQKNRLTHIST